MSDIATVHLNVPPAVKAAWVLQSRVAGMRLTDWVTKHMEAISIEAAVVEIGSIAESITDHPIYFGSAQTREGVEAMIQAAKAFSAATSDTQRADAALWVGEAYLIFSASLPDTGSSEQATGWATAHQIKKLLGGPGVWVSRVKAQYE